MLNLFQQAEELMAKRGSSFEEMLGDAYELLRVADAGRARGHRLAFVDEQGNLVRNAAGTDIMVVPDRKPKTKG